MKKTLALFLAMLCVLLPWQALAATVLEVGSSGSNVTKVQQRLIQYGYLSGTHVRDKDAVNASLLIIEAAAYYAQKGMNLGDAIDSLYETFGYYRNDLCSFTFEGVSGMQTMKNLMERLRAEKPAELAGRKVLSSVDYENDDTGLPKAQVLEYRLEGKAKLIVRPSGTEPKIKVYLSAVGKTREEADSVIETMKRTANELMKA